MLPTGTGFIDKNSDDYRAYIENYKISEMFINAFCRGISVSNTLREITLRDTLLSTSHAIKIIESMHYHIIKILDISFN